MPLGLDLPSHSLCFSASGSPHLESLGDPFDRAVVTVRMSGRNCRIEWDAKAVTSAALQAAVAHVKSLRFSGSLTIAFKAGEWEMEEIYPDHKAAFERIQETAKVLGELNGLVASPYRLEKADFEDAFINRRTGIDATWEAWSRAKGKITPEFLADLDAAGMLQRAIILDYDDSQHGLVFRFVGWGYGKRFGHDWPVRAIGTRHDHGQPDDSYTRWIARQYDTAFEGDPRRDYIDSMVRVGEPGPSDRFQYERVLLPSRFVNGAPALIAVSIVRPGLLPLLPASAPGPATGQTDPSRSGSDKDRHE